MISRFQVIQICFVLFQKRYFPAFKLSTFDTYNLSAKLLKADFKGNLFL